MVSSSAGAVVSGGKAVVVILAVVICTGAVVWIGASVAAAVAAGALGARYTPVFSARACATDTGGDTCAVCSLLSIAPHPAAVRSSSASPAASPFCKPIMLNTPIDQSDSIHYF